MKYEEKLDDADRWSKPHVPTVSLNALFEVRKAIYEDNCAILLDLEAQDGCLHHLSGALLTRFLCLAIVLHRTCYCNSVIIGLQISPLRPLYSPLH